jgi:hypothetical protein
MAVSEIGWTTLAANSGEEWFIHGWSNNHAVVYGIVVFAGTGAGVPNPVGRATLTQGRFFENFGTRAQLIHIQNNAPFNTCNVRILAQFEAL